MRFILIPLTLEIPFSYHNLTRIWYISTFQLAKTISRFLLALSTSGNLIIYCITSDVFRRVLWQQILFVYYTFCPSRNPANRRRYDVDNSPTCGTTVDMTRIDRRSPIPGSKPSAQEISLVKIGKRNGMLDSINPDSI